METFDTNFYASLNIWKDVNVSKEFSIYRGIPEHFCATNKNFKIFNTLSEKFL